MQFLINPDDLEGSYRLLKCARRRQSEAMLKKRERFDKDVVVRKKSRSIPEDALEQSAGAAMLRIGPVGERVKRGGVDEDHLRRRFGGASASANARSWFSDTGD